MDEKIIGILDEIMDEFDFEKVKAVMDNLDWKWAYTQSESGVPTLDEIKQIAANLLWALATDPDPENTVHATGGFRAERDFSDPDDPWIRLAFEVTDWDAAAAETV